MAQVIHFPGAGAKAPAAMVPGCTAAVYQLRPRDKWDGMTWLTEEQKRVNREADAAGRERIAARKRFGNRLRVVRLCLGLSFEAAADVTSVKPQTFKKYESGAVEMNSARLMAFANHPTVALRGFLLTWLLEDGAPADKESAIRKYCASANVAFENSLARAINCLDIASRC